MQAPQAWLRGQKHTGCTKLTKVTRGFVDDRRENGQAKDWKYAKIWLEFWECLGEQVLQVLLQCRPEIHLESALAHPVQSVWGKHVTFEGVEWP